VTRGDAWAANPRQPNILFVIADDTTLPRQAQQAGYRNCMVGKNDVLEPASPGADRHPGRGP
jgi:arylsulfatase A-like enzyme